MTEISSPASPTRRLNRRRWYFFHGWVGFNLSLVLGLICLTGALATVGDEIDWLLNPALRVSSSDGPVNWVKIHERVMATYPDRAIRMMTAPVGSAFASAVSTVLPNQVRRLVYVHPTTGDIQGERSALTAKRFLRDFHTGLFLPGDVGYIVVPIFGFILLGSLVTGLMTYKQWWQGWWRLRREKGRRVIWADLHKLIGLWSVWFLLTIGITGSWYFIELFGAGIETKEPPVMQVVLKDLGLAPPERLSLSTLVFTVQQKFPELEIRRIWPASSPTDVWRFRGQTEAWLVRDRSNTIHLTPYSGVVSLIQRTNDTSALHRWTDMADPLHFGDFGGFVSKLIWCVFGLGLSGLLGTGAYLRVTRLQKIEKANHQHVVAQKDLATSGSDASSH